MSERLDGRDENTLRQLSMTRASLHRADGSASWTQEGTEVLAGVYGPVEASARREDAEKAVVEVLFRPLSGLAGQAEREIEALVRRTVEVSLLSALHPRTTVQVVLQVRLLVAASAASTGVALRDSSKYLVPFRLC